MICPRVDLVAVVEEGVEAVSGVDVVVIEVEVVEGVEVLVIEVVEVDSVAEEEVALLLIIKEILWNSKDLDRPFDLIN